jgi:hypothetical protein
MILTLLETKCNADVEAKLKTPIQIIRYIPTEFKVEKFNVSQVLIGCAQQQVSYLNFT